MPHPWSALNKTAYEEKIRRSKRKAFPWGTQRDWGPSLFTFLAGKAPTARVDVGRGNVITRWRKKEFLMADGMSSFGEAQVEKRPHPFPQGGNR